MADHMSDERLDEIESERVAREAERLARRAVCSSGEPYDWREAGYATPEAAARVLLGADDGSPEWALMAERLRASDAARLLGRRGGEAGAGRPKRRPSGLTYRPRRREV